jgi:hypothetical protein
VIFANQAVDIERAQFYLVALGLAQARRSMRPGITFIALPPLDQLREFAKQFLATTHHRLLRIAIASPSWNHRWRRIRRYRIPRRHDAAKNSQPPRARYSFIRCRSGKVRWAASKRRRTVLRGA